MNAFVFYSKFTSVREFPGPACANSRLVFSSVREFPGPACANSSCMKGVDEGGDALEEVAVHVEITVGLIKEKQCFL